MSTKVDDTIKAWMEKVLAFVKAGRILILSHEVRADSKKTLLGDTPVFQAKDGDLEALALIHEPVGGAVYITSTVNTGYRGSVGTSNRNLIQNDKRTDIKTLEESSKELGFVAPAFYLNHRYGDSQETDAVIRECNKRLRELDKEWAVAVEANDKAKAKAIIKEQAEVNATKADRELDIKFAEESK